MKRKRTGVVKVSMKRRLIVRAATEDGTKNLLSTGDISDALMYRDQNPTGKATWVDEIHVCEHPDCSSQTLYNVCRKHANGKPRYLFEARDSPHHEASRPTEGHTD